MLHPLPGIFGSLASKFTMFDTSDPIAPVATLTLKLALKPWKGPSIIAVPCRTSASIEVSMETKDHVVSPELLFGFGSAMLKRSLVVDVLNLVAFQVSLVFHNCTTSMLELVLQSNSMCAP